MSSDLKPNGFEIIDAINRIEAQMEMGYLDIGGVGDDVEMYVVGCALREFKKNHDLEDDFPNCQLSGCEGASSDCHKTCPHGVNNMEDKNANSAEN